MAHSCLKVAQGLLNHGRLSEKERLGRTNLLDQVDVPDGTFRHAGEYLGAKRRPPGLRFFDSSVDGRLAFGPGAGLVVGVSIGTESLRATLVDANGWVRESYDAEAQAGQLDASRDELLERIRGVVGEVLRRAVDRPELLVDDELPLLGSAVAWPTPISHAKRSVGHALPHRSWGRGEPLDLLVGERLGIRNLPCFALNDAHAAAIGVAHRLTHLPEYQSWKHPQLTIVLRLAGAIGGAVILVEPPEDGRRRGDRTERRYRAGFQESILLAGLDNHSGGLGHVPVDPGFVEALNAGVPAELGKIEPHSCHCTPADETVPHHLEAYASAMSLARRLDRERTMHEVLGDVLADQEDKRHARALSDVGKLVAQALTGPVAVLNPSRVVITGLLAVQPVSDVIETRLRDEPHFGARATVEPLPEPDNRNIRAQGAALALIRVRLHRRLESLLVDDRDDAARLVAGLTTRLSPAVIHGLFGAG